MNLKKETQWQPKLLKPVSGFISDAIVENELGVICPRNSNAY